MHGGVSHVDTFDPKPELAKHSGETISAEMAKGLKTNRIDFAKAPMRGSPWKFSKHGQCGMEISELFPGIASKADEIALIRSCYGDAFDHAPGMYLRNSGSQFPGQAEPRLVGRVRARLGEPEPAGVRRDVGRRDEVGTRRVQRRLSAGGVSGHGVSQRAVPGAEPGESEGRQPTRRSAIRST